MTNTAINNEVMNRAELDDEMMDMVNGGSWYGDAWKYVKKNKEYFIVAGCTVVGAALCATGAGAAAGVGLIAGTVGSSATVGGLLGASAGGVLSIAATVDLDEKK